MNVAERAPVASEDGGQLVLEFYDELHRVARARIARLASGQILTPTELVHEIYLRVATDKPVRFEGRRHFFFVACRAMQDTLVEHVRRKASYKRGGEHQRVDLPDMAVASPVPREDILALNRAIEKLRSKKPAEAQVVQLRYFGGFTIEETAEVAQCSAATVKRRWNDARTWLQHELSTHLR